MYKKDVSSFLQEKILRRFFKKQRGAGQKLLNVFIRKTSLLRINTQKIRKKPVLYINRNRIRRQQTVCFGIEFYI